MGYQDMRFPENSTFLVTGGAGFIGSNLCEAILNLGYPVRCLDDLSTGKKENLEPFLSHPGFEFRKGDIKDQETWRRGEACQEALKTPSFTAPITSQAP